MNLEAESTTPFLGQRPHAATARASGDGASVKDGLVFASRPSLRTKLLAAFLVIEVLLFSVGIIGLLSLREADQHANQVVALSGKTVIAIVARAENCTV